MVALILLLSVQQRVGKKKKKKKIAPSKIVKSFNRKYLSSFVTVFLIIQQELKLAETVLQLFKKN